MIVCKDPQFVCFFPPQTASASLKAALRSVFKFRDYAPHHGLNQKYFEEFQDFLTIVSVRNPFTRLISHYRHVLDPRHIPRVKNTKNWLLGKEQRVEKTRDANILGFVNYFKKHQDHPRPITTMCKGVTFGAVVRKENFLEDLKKLPLPGIENAKTHHNYHKRTPLEKIGATWQDFYKDSPELVDWVRNHYKADFEMFGYSDEL